MKYEMTIPELPQTISVAHGENMVLTIEDLIVRDKLEYAVWIRINSGSFQFALGRKPSNRSVVHSEGEAFKLFICEMIRGLKRQGQAEKLNFIASPEGGSFNINLYL